VRAVRNSPPNVEVIEVDEPVGDRPVRVVAVRPPLQNLRQQRRHGPRVAEVEVDAETIDQQLLEVHWPVISHAAASWLGRA